MGPVQSILFFVALAAMTVVGYVVARLTAPTAPTAPTALTPKPEPKRFGLKETEAAAEIAKAAARELGSATAATETVKKTVAKALKGFTVRILGHEDTVDSELATLAAEMAARNDVLKEEIITNGHGIENLAAKIRALEDENNRLQLDTLGNDHRLAEVLADVALFTA